MQSIRKKSFAAEQLALRQKNKKNPVVWVLVGVVVVALVIGGYVVYQRSVVQKHVETEKIKSIAVLPFVDMSPDKDQEWFCDGISETILNNLTQIDDLIVIARTSAFSFKGKDITVDEIAKKLNAETILEGSVIKSGNRLQITAQLIKADQGYHIWSNTYKREAEDVFPIIEEISLKIVEALKGEVLGVEKVAIEKRYTENKEANNFYFLGRYHLYNRSEEEINKALSYFRRAIEIDPQYALACAGIADSYHVSGISHYLSPQEAYAESKKWAQKALETDDTIAEPYISLASISLWYDWNWEAARNNYKRALELNPSNADAHHWYADYFKAMGNYEEALVSMKRSHEIDPLSYIVNLMLPKSIYDLIIVIKGSRSSYACSSHSKAVSSSSSPK